MKIKIDFYNEAFDLGYNTAKGKLGTGWMAYSKGDCDVDFSDINNIDEWVNEWTQTNQWEYETKELFDKLVKDEKEEWLDDYADIRTGWVNGYVEYIREEENV